MLTIVRITNATVMTNKMFYNNIKPHTQQYLFTIQFITASPKDEHVTIIKFKTKAEPNET